MSDAQLDHSPSRFTFVQLLVCVIAIIGFAFDIYELLMLPLILRPALMEFIHAPPNSPEFIEQFAFWRGILFFRAGLCGRHFRFVGRLPDRSLGPPARADWQHSAVCGFRVRRRLLDQHLHAAVLPLHDVHRGVRRVRGGGGLAGRVVPQPHAAGSGAGDDAGLFVGRRPDGGHGQWDCRGLGGRQARTAVVRIDSAGRRTCRRLCCRNGSPGCWAGRSRTPTPLGVTP